MYRRVSAIVGLAVVLLLSISIDFAQCSTSTIPVDRSSEENEDSNIPVPSSTLPIEEIAITTTTTITAPVEQDIEEIVDNVTDPTTTTTTTTTTVEVIVEEAKKQFLTQYLLNASVSSSSGLTYNTDLHQSILLIFHEHELVLVDKTDGTVQKYFKYADVIPVDQQSKDSSPILVIFDDNARELWIFESGKQQSASIAFKPKQIHVLSPSQNVWVAETSDQVALYVSHNAGLEWKSVDVSGSAVILGWSAKANSLVINQHSRFIKLLDVTTYRMTSILTDVASAKLFSRYLLAKRSSTNDAITISHVNNLADEGFRSLPERFQSEGNFYCAVEDRYTEDLLFVFITESRLSDNNETIPSTCNVIGYSRQNQFQLKNIDCQFKSNETVTESIECSNQQISLTQVQGLSKRVFLANVASGPTTMVSFDSGATWNRTFFECDKTSNCPSNASLVISSLVSSAETPGIVVGKASDGVNEYVAVSTDNGQLWRLTGNVNGDQIGVSSPSAVVLMVPREKEASLIHKYRYSTDYGRHWFSGTFLNETSTQVLSLVPAKNNTFYLLTSDQDNSLSLVELDFNILIGVHCARHQLKEWNLHGTCINGSKHFYKRRISGAHCLDDASNVRTEACACSLIDFECSPGYRRAKDGTCLPRAHYSYAQDCTCHANTSLATKRRGYVKSANSQCSQGVETYLSDAYVLRRDSQQPNFFIFGTDARTKRSIVEIHANGFDSHDADDDEDEENLVKNTVWLVDPTYEITASVFDENTKQTYMAVEHDQSAIIYKTSQNLREQNRLNKQLIFDANNELYKNVDARIEYLTMDWFTQNLYVLLRNKKSLQQSIVLVNTRTHKRRTIATNQLIQPAILIVDPIKADLYWITHQSSSIFTIANLQGQIKRQVALSSVNANVTYMSYDPITHEIIFVAGSTIYGLNTLDRQHRSPRVIYEHSAEINNPLFIHPVLYFTNDHNETESTSISLHAIDVLAKSFAKDIARFKDFQAVKLFVDMAPTMPTTTTGNPCASSPCADICIPLDHGRFRCVCGEDARYQSCSCPIEERFAAGACQAKNEQCAPGRVLCQNRLNCAESAQICEQDHTQYTEAFKTSARCQLDEPNDGFDCYYTSSGATNANNTCIPFEWLCDGVYDCPLRNDEEHCDKLTTTKITPTKTPSRCLTEKKFTHVMCRNRCMKISDVCRSVSNALSCPEQFHLHCKQTQEKNQYACKCHDHQDRCIAMIEACDDFEHCERICNESVHYANSKSSFFGKPSSRAWTILIVLFVVILFIIILVLVCLRYRRRRKQVPATSRTPPTAATEAKIDSPPSDVREKLLKNGSNPAANETS